MLSAGGVGEHAVLDERRDRERGRDSSGEQASFVVYQWPLLVTKCYVVTGSQLAGQEGQPVLH